MNIATATADTGTTVLEAIKAGMSDAMDADSDVILMGEDVGLAGGIFRTSTGLHQRFGSKRVIDTPLDEKGIVAHGIGLALYGLKPIVEIQFSGFKLIGHFFQKCFLHLPRFISYRSSLFFIAS